MPNLDSRVGRYLGVLAAAALLAGVSAEAGAYGGKGVIRLQLGKPGTADGFYLYKPDFTTPTGHYQQFHVIQKCIVDNVGWGLDSLAGDPGKLVNLQPLGPGVDNPDPRAGLLSGSLGVYDNSKGVSCTRMTAAIDEGLFIESLAGGFDRLELDMELKGNAVFELQIVGAPYVYTLRSGTNKIPGGYEGEADKNNLVVNCEGSSDSGPDSGPNDNCRWTINDVGTSFYLTPTAGEGSLEGGGDFSNPLVDTKIFLTSLIDVGTLGCDNTNNKTAMVYGDATSSGAASCQVTRINHVTTPGFKCDLINYRLETFTASSLCTLDKTGYVDTNLPTGVDKQLVGSLKVTFKPESKPLDPVVASPASWYAIKPTVIQFSPGVDFTAYRCGGTVVDDSNSNKTIDEVLKGTLKGKIVNGQFVARSDGDTVLSASNDANPSSALYEWACILESKDVYQGGEKIQVEQTILFWGDIAFLRP